MPSLLSLKSSSRLAKSSSGPVGSGKLFLLLLVAAGILLGFHVSRGGDHYLTMADPSVVSSLTTAEVISPVSSSTRSTLLTKTASTTTAANHMLSLEPLKQSLHPKWKLWTEMTTEQQDQTLDYLGRTYLTKYGKLIQPSRSRRQ